MVCHGNHAISHNQNGFILGQYFCLHLGGRIEQIGIHKKLS